MSENDKPTNCPKCLGNDIVVAEEGNYWGIWCRSCYRAISVEKQVVHSDQRQPKRGGRRRTDKQQVQT